MAKSKIVEANKKIADGLKKSYKKIEKGTTSSYKKIENGVVKTYKKIEDKFVDQFLTKDGETIEDAKKRIKIEQQELKNKSKKLKEENK